MTKFIKELFTNKPSVARAAEAKPSEVKVIDGKKMRALGNGQYELIK